MHNWDRSEMDAIDVIAVATLAAAGPIAGRAVARGLSRESSRVDAEALRAVEAGGEAPEGWADGVSRALGRAGVDPALAMRLERAGVIGEADAARTRMPWYGRAWRGEGPAAVAVALAGALSTVAAGAAAGWPAALAVAWLACAAVVDERFHALPAGLVWLGGLVSLAALVAMGSVAGCVAWAATAAATGLLSRGMPHALGGADPVALAACTGVSTAAGGLQSLFALALATLGEMVALLAWLRASGSGDGRSQVALVPLLLAPTAVALLA